MVNNLNVYFIVECSGEMQGVCIGAVNHSIEGLLIPTLCQLSEEHPNTELMVRVMSYGTGAKWQTNCSVPIRNFVWNDLYASGCCDMGAAFNLLSEEFEMMDKTIESQMPPVVVVLSYLGSTDNVMPALNRFNNTKWSEKAIKIAITIGNEHDTSVLEKFTGDKNNILPSNEALNLCSFLKWNIVKIQLSESLRQEQRNFGLNQIMKHYPMIWENPKRFKALLMDYYPDNKLLRNLILASVEERIPHQLSKMESYDKSNVYRFARVMTDSYGCTMENATEIVDLWMNALGIKLNSSDITDYIVSQIHDDRQEHIFIVIDVASMSFEREQIIRECLSILWDKIKEEAQGNIYTDVSILTYAVGCKWVMRRENILTAEFPNIQFYEEDSNFADAIQELNKAMEHFQGKCIEPVVLFVLNHEPIEYIDKLEKIRPNPWYKLSIKVVFGLLDRKISNFARELCWNPESDLTIQGDDLREYKNKFEKLYSKMICRILYSELKDDGLNDGYYTDEMIYSHEV